MYRKFLEDRMSNSSTKKSETEKGNDAMRSSSLVASVKKTATVDDELKYKLIDDASKGEVKLFKRNEDLLKRATMKALADYDDRTPLHLASAQGHLDLVKYMVDTLGNDVFFKDRWGRTAYDEALRSEQKEVAKFLKTAMDRGKPENLSHKIIDAAYKGDLQYLRKCHTLGHDMSFADYDNRTPLHLAVAEGHKDVVEFLIRDCKVDQTIKDREGSTAFAEARRYKNKEMEDLILKLNDLI